MANPGNRTRETPNREILKRESQEGWDSKGGGIAALQSARATGEKFLLLAIKKWGQDPRKERRRIKNTRAGGETSIMSFAYPPPSPRLLQTPGQGKQGRPVLSPNSNSPLPSSNDKMGRHLRLLAAQTLDSTPSLRRERRG